MKSFRIQLDDRTLAALNRIAAAECFAAAHKARGRGDTARAASLETQGRTIARWGGGKRHS